MVNEQYFGRACKTCRRRGRGCDRRMPSCNTCEASGQKCEGYLLQWPGLASRGQFVGKSIPVPGTTKRRRTRRAQQPTARTPSPPTAPQSPQSPVNDVQTEPQENQVEDLLDPLQLFVGIPENHASPGLLTWSDEFALVDIFPEDITEPQLSLAITPPPQDQYKDLGGSLSFYNTLGSSLDCISIPDELKFIMQYRESCHFQGGSVH
ncbi:uncharacterized protein N7483_010221 [Penicillium malachiteum]|uniref:uncharacterized protein n=1 Tax=Penicillium malachiteum TaxID=1324776 RepID=UPI0025496FC0|nr:uncharacterized protein N7483_010221 [Penicillium malachiteum]KAJ5713040.1 hypothetical protein N7483_010221 [Penicillium malachiteum]